VKERSAWVAARRKAESSLPPGREPWSTEEPRAQGRGTHARGQGRLDVVKSTAGTDETETRASQGGRPAVHLMYRAPSLLRAFEEWREYLDTSRTALGRVPDPGLPGLHLVSLSYGGSSPSNPLHSTQEDREVLRGTSGPTGWYPSYPCGASLGRVLLNFLLLPFFEHHFHRPPRGSSL